VALAPKLSTPKQEQAIKNGEKLSGRNPEQMAVNKKKTRQKHRQCNAFERLYCLPGKEEVMVPNPIISFRHRLQHKQAKLKIKLRQPVSGLCLFEEQKREEIVRLSSH
jgi:hypothetical protein